MWDALAHDSSAVTSVPFCLLSEAPSRRRSRSPLRVVAPTTSPPSSRETRLDCPRYEVDVVGSDVLSLRLFEQPLEGDRRLLEHSVQGRLKNGALELELYRSGIRSRLLSVGVWTCGAYVHWRNERALDFSLLDSVDLVLRDLLPPGGGVVTLARAGALASGDGVKWGSFRS